MSKPYHLMTDAERIAARIASNRAIQGRVVVSSARAKKRNPGQATKSDPRNFSRLGHAFLDALPDMAKGTEAANLLKLSRSANARKE
jgi:hypothetical protein